MFVLPGSPRGTPEVMTILSPLSTRDSLFISDIAFSTDFSSSVVIGQMQGVTPQIRESCRQVESEGVIAIIGQGGRYLLTIRAVPPLEVSDTIAAALTSFAMSRAAWLTASAVSQTCGIVRGFLRQSSVSFSVRMIIRCIVSTASTGYFPPAVSPESMTASAPSITALATSLASARVGRGLRIIESSIWVATITGLPCTRHFSMISFWTIGTSSVFISTPRSPRATIMPSPTESISSIFSTDCLVSIFAIIFAFAPAPSRMRRTSIMSSLLRTKETAT